MCQENLTYFIFLKSLQIYIEHLKFHTEIVTSLWTILNITEYVNYEYTLELEISFTPLK